METIIVTGAGGTIGSALVKHLHRAHNKETILQILALDNSEYNLYQLGQWADSYERYNVHIEPLITDIRHNWVVDSIMEQAKYENLTTIYHTAALKHVPLLQTKHNALEAIRTNIGGTKVVLDSAIHHNVKNFVLVSTDKAVNPSSMMGATKSYAEGYCLDKSNVRKSDTTVSIVRFGNVYGSSGSVVELFNKQIANGMDLTVTDKSMTRYFITVEEAVSLVTSAKELGGGLYMLDMGEAMNIYNLAEKLIEESGNKTIGIKVVGVRSGEKLHESLHTELEKVTKTTKPKINKIEGNEETRYPDFAIGISDLLKYCDLRDLVGALNCITSIVPYEEVGQL